MDRIRELGCGKVCFYCRSKISSLFSFQDSGLADYSLEVKVHSYTNPSHKDADGQCCNFWHFPLPGCISQCSNIFLFCPFNTTSQRARPDNCPLGMQLFKGNDTIVGLDYTLIFSGTTWPVGCKKYMYTSNFLLYLCNFLKGLHQYVHSSFILISRDLVR